MMKKEYINPEMEVVVLNMNQQLLAGSEMGFGDPTSEMDAPELDLPGTGLPGLPGSDLPGFGF